MNTSGHRILIVDDEPSVSQIVRRWLAAEGYQCFTRKDADEAMEFLKGSSVSLMITDINMPGRSGMELLRLTRDGHRSVAVIMLTGVDDRHTAIQALHLGAYGYMIKPLDQNELIINVSNALERRRLVLEAEAHQQRLEAEVRERTEEIRRTQEEIVLRLVAAAEFRDTPTACHIRRIGEFAAVFAQALGWDAKRVDDLRVAAPMHDVGKIGLPDEILRKPGKLTLNERAVVEAHPQIGARILENSHIPLLQMAREIALYHHEKWDGTGYQFGLAGEDIPAAARLVAIVDVYDALSSNRVYRPALPEAEILEIMREGKGRHFDPQMTQTFLEILPEFKAIRARFPDPRMPD